MSEFSIAIPPNILTEWKFLTNATSYDIEIWKLQMKALLKSVNLYKLVTGDYPEPKDKTNFSWESWSRDDARAWLLISSNLDQSIFYKLSFSNKNALLKSNSKELWDLLDTIVDKNKT